MAKFHILTLTFLYFIGIILFGLTVLSDILDFILSSFYILLILLYLVYLCNFLLI